jgi:hypothetical protein
MALKQKHDAMGAEKNQSGIPNEDDEDDKHLFGVSPSPEKAPVAKVDR